MKVRWLSLAVFALVLATAFAPAPFVRTERKKGLALVLSRFQGKWKTEKKERMGANNDLQTVSNSQSVIIDGSSWRFASSFEGKGGKGKAPKNGGGGFGNAKGGKGKGPARKYELVLMPNTFPQGFRLARGTRDQEDYMVGILTVEGDVAKVVYRLGTVEGVQQQPPFDFENIPEGWYRLTLRRDK